MEQINLDSKILNRIIELLEVDSKLLHDEYNVASLANEVIEFMTEDCDSSCIQEEFISNNAEYYINFLLVKSDVALYVALKSRSIDILNILIDSSYNKVIIAEAKNRINFLEEIGD